MNCKLIYKMLTGILALCLLHAGGIGLASAAQPAAAHAADGSAAGRTGVAANGRLDPLSPTNAGKGWTCPMHPEVHKHEPGKCPICKMNLVKAKSQNS